MFFILAGNTSPIQVLLSALVPSSHAPLIITLSPPAAPQLPHVRFVGVDLTAPCPFLLFSHLSFFIFFVVFVFLGLVFPECDEWWVQLIQRDGCGVLDVLFQRVSAGLVLLRTAAYVDH